MGLWVNGIAQKRGWHFSGIAKHVSESHSLTFFSGLTQNVSFMFCPCRKRIFFSGLVKKRVWPLPGLPKNVSGPVWPFSGLSLIGEGKGKTSHGQNGKGATPDRKGLPRIHWTYTPRARTHDTK